jgi:hypothetical protein
MAPRDFVPPPKRPRSRPLDVEDLVLNYDPEFPQRRFLEAGVEAAFLSATGRLPSVVP